MRHLVLQEGTTWSEIPFLPSVVANNASKGFSSKRIRQPFLTVNLEAENYILHHHIHYHRDIGSLSLFCHLFSVHGR